MAAEDNKCDSIINIAIDDFRCFSELQFVNRKLKGKLLGTINEMMTNKSRKEEKEGGGSFSSIMSDAEKQHEDECNLNHYTTQRHLPPP